MALSKKHRVNDHIMAHLWSDGHVGIACVDRTSIVTADEFNALVEARRQFLLETYDQRMELTDEQKLEAKQLAAKILGDAR